VSENCVLRKIFGPETAEVMEEWREVINVMLHNLCSSPHIVRLVITMRKRNARYDTHMGEVTISYRILFRKPEVKISLGSP
jgi:hypothetical protein